MQLFRHEHYSECESLWHSSSSPKRIEKNVKEKPEKRVRLVNLESKRNEKVVEVFQMPGKTAVNSFRFQLKNTE